MRAKRPKGGEKNFFLGMLSLIKSCHKYWNIPVPGLGAGGREERQVLYSMSSHVGDHPGKYTPGGAVICYVLQEHT